MNREDGLDKIYKKLAEREAEEKREEKLNPLSKYSTTQLKAELRRRKKG